MGLISLVLPSVGEKVTSSDPRIVTAFSTLQTVINGNLNKENLASSVLAEIGEKKSVYVASEETAGGGTSFAKMSTADEVTITLPTEGLLGIAFHATVTSSVAAAGRVAIFLETNQIKANASTPAVIETPTEGTVANIIRTSSEAMLTSSGGGYTGDVTTGQIAAAPWYVFAAAGTYKVSVQYRATSGTIKAKERKLWAWLVT